MLTRLLADIVLLLHFAWVVFMVAGFPLALWLRSRWLRLLHALGLGFYLALAAGGEACPLTHVEEHLRRMSDQDFSYYGSFLAAWAGKIIYVENWGASLRVFRLLAVLYLALVISSFWWWPRKGGPGGKPAGSAF